MSLHGHLWTLGPHVVSTLRPPSTPPAVAWSTGAQHPEGGAIRLTGLFTRASTRDLVVLVHGLGGHPDADYMRRAAAAVHRAGPSTLRLALRGADRSGHDYYHAALTEDLHAALASPALTGFERIFVVGFSLGGHMTLRAATEPAIDPRVVAVCGVCPPLDLRAGQRHLDQHRLKIYRHHVLRGLKAIYAGVAARGPVPLPLASARRITTLFDWDEAVVAPRHGFSGARDYYERASAGPHLPALRRPALIVAAEQDPMVPAASLRPYLEAPAVTEKMARAGGHVAFPATSTSGSAAPRA